jgi:hypothetical protein
MRPQTITTELESHHHIQTLRRRLPRPPMERRHLTRQPLGKKPNKTTHHKKTNPKNTKNKNKTGTAKKLVTHPQNFDRTSKFWLKLLGCAVDIIFERVHLTTEVNLDKVYQEVKRMRQELKTIENSLDSLLESLIPEGEELSGEEANELDVLSKEIDEGECVSLEQVMAKCGAPKRGKVHSKVSQKNR